MQTVTHCHLPYSLSMETIGGIWGIAQSTNNKKKLITTCLPRLASNIPRIVEMELTLDKMKELLQLPSIKCIGTERQLRLVENWMDEKHTGTSYAGPVGQLVNLLMDLKSMSEDAFCNFITSSCKIMSAGIFSCSLFTTWTDLNNC